MHLLRKCQRAFESISSEWSFCAGAAAGALFAPAALFLCLILPRSRALCAAAGTMLLLVCRVLPLVFAPAPFEAFLDDRAATIDFEIRLTDLRLSSVPGLEQPRGVRAELIRFNFAGDRERHLCGGDVTVYANYPLPRRPGAVVAGQGALLPPEADRPGGGWILLCDSWQLKRVENSWRDHILKIRDKLLIRLCSHIRDDTNRNLAAAFFFGNTGGMTPERRRDFAAAGTVHLFAVSGLHVGMAALLILFMVRLLPFRIRYFTAAAGIWGYVMLTGAAVPALRAGFMISLLLVCRGMLLTTPSLRLLGIAAGIIIIADPGALSSIGFHYSFLITAVLLLLSEKLQILHRIENRIFTIMPCTPENLAKRRGADRIFALKSMMLSGIAAVLAGSVVSLYHNMALTPGAVIANWFTMPVLGILYLLLPVKLLASLTTDSADRCAAQGISFLFDYLRSVAEITGELALPFYVRTPGVFSAVLMTVLLLAALSLKNRKTALISGVLFLVLLLAFPLSSLLARSRVTVISSDASTPATVVISDRKIGEITLVNPAREHNLSVEKVLKSSGIPIIREVGFSAPYVRHITGLHYLGTRYRIEKVIVPPLSGKNWQFSDRITERKGDFHYVQEGKGGEKLRLFREKNKFAIEYPDSGVMLGWRLEISDRDNGRAVRFIRRGKESTVILPWRNKNGVWQHEL